MLIALEKGASQVDPFGLLDIAGTSHMTYKYVCMRHKASTSLGSSSFLTIPHGEFKLKVTFCVTAVNAPVTMFPDLRPAARLRSPSERA